MYDLILLGPSRSGTTTLWHDLGKHPSISPSLIKEPLAEYREPGGFSDTYFDKYYTTVKSTKYLLDGCPIDTFIDLESVMESLRKVKVIRNMKYITLLRPLHIRSFSYANLLLTSYFSGSRYKPPFLDENNILLEREFVQWMARSIKRPYVNLCILEDAYIDADSIFIAELNNLKNVMTKLLKFLDIGNVKLNIGKRNALTKIKWPYEYVKRKETVNLMYDKNSKYFNHLSEKYIKRIERDYKVTP